MPAMCTLLSPGRARRNSAAFSITSAGSGGGRRAPTAVSRTHESHSEGAVLDQARLSPTDA